MYMFRFVFIFLFFATPAFSYIDPGTGSIIVQALIAGIAGIAVFYSNLKNKILTFFKNIKSKKNKIKDIEN